jgi:hypothetical protein
MKIVILFLIFYTLSYSQTYYFNEDTICQIKNITLPVEYKQLGAFFFISSFNSIRNRNVNPNNLMITYNISNTGLNCSYSYSNSELFDGGMTKERIAEASCRIVDPILFDLNLTVEGAV